MILGSYLISILTAYATFSLIKRPGVTPTRASSSLSLLCFLFLFGLRQFYTFDMNHFALLIFGASFVGMCSHKVVKALEVTIGAVVFTSIYIDFMPSSYGVGGALGFSAFTSVLVACVSSRLVFFKAKSV